MQGNDVDPSILLKYCSENVDNIGNSRSGGESTNETGGSPAKQSRTTLFDIISDCNIEVGICVPNSCVHTFIIISSQIVLYVQTFICLAGLLTLICIYM